MLRIFVIMKYDKHFFVCQNERSDSSKKSCGKEQAQLMVQALRESIREVDCLSCATIRVRAQACACLDACAEGPSLVVYPDGVWYGRIQPSDAREIVEAHLKNLSPVRRLQIFRNPAHDEPDATAE
jgi:(2Fe-2S) ferredoxin